MGRKGLNERSPRIVTVNDVVERGVGIFVGNVVARQTIQEIHGGMSLCRSDGGGWYSDELVGLAYKRVPSEARGSFHFRCGGEGV